MSINDKQFIEDQILGEGQSLHRQITRCRARGESTEFLRTKLRRLKKLEDHIKSTPAAKLNMNAVSKMYHFG